MVAGGETSGRLGAVETPKAVYGAVGVPSERLEFEQVDAPPTHIAMSVRPQLPLPLSFATGVIETAFDGLCRKRYGVSHISSVERCNVIRI